MCDKKISIFQYRQYLILSIRYGEKVPDLDFQSILDTIFSRLNKGALLFPAMEKYMFTPALANLQSGSINYKYHLFEIFHENQRVYFSVFIDSTEHLFIFIKRHIYNTNVLSAKISHIWLDHRNYQKNL